MNPFVPELITDFLLNISVLRFNLKSQVDQQLKAASAALPSLNAQ